MTGERIKLDRNGDVRSVAEWADVVKIPAQVIIWRIKLQGWTVEKALSTPYHPNNKGGEKVYEYHDRKMGLADWARELNRPYSYLQNRLDRGWTFEEAVETPPNESPPRLVKAREEALKTPPKKKDPCRGCTHWRHIVDGANSGPMCCHYLLDTKKLRPCPGGEGCTVKNVGVREKQKPKSICLKGTPVYYDLVEDERRIESW